MYGILGSKNKQTEKIKRGIDETLLPVLDGTINKINSILENKDQKQDRLRLSQVKELQKEVRGLIIKGKELYSQANTKEEKEKVIEQILMSMDYLFAKINAKRVFVRYPIINNKQFHNKPIQEQSMRFMLPDDYNIQKLDSVVGGNCYSFISIYYNIIREIVGDDKDIVIKYYIDNNDYHGTSTINEKFLIDSNLSKFLESNGIKQKKSNFYKFNEKDNINELLNKLGVIKCFNSIEEFFDSNEVSINLKRTSLIIGGENWITFNISRINNKIVILFLKGNGGRNLVIKFDSENTNSNINYSPYIGKLIDFLSKKEEDKILLGALFNKIDREILIELFKGLDDFNSSKIKIIPGLIVKIFDFGKRVIKKLKLLRLEKNFN
ncbi:hypothetical protein EOM39_01915 [Candidatus Gracilibacteria bacterium]|nr:hypothetical protein [Candidatus Gracilibacteria bacterium]